MLSILPTAIHTLIAAFLFTNGPSPRPTSTRFTLRHSHAISNTSRIVFSDLPQSLTGDPYTYNVPTCTLKTHRPHSAAAFAAARMRSILHMQSEPLAWHDEDVPGPDVTKRETLLQLAKMTYNAYSLPIGKDWYELDGYNTSYPFGWEPDADGLRGHVFVSDDNSTVVVSIKGTSAPWIAGGGGPTTRKDKTNDNLLFSCCCARVGPTWSPVCGCYEGGYRCDQTCVETALVDEGLFYPTGMNLYNNITYMYPNANIWITGHSLGGGLASLIGVTFGAPVVAFEAPGERLAAKRLHLPSPPSTQHITHVYHTGDPVPIGACTGVTSACAIGGFALETGCHLGKVIRYDTVSKRGWSVSVQGHPIKFVIERVLNEDWEGGDGEGEGEGKGKGREVPEAVEEEDCVDCFSWEFGEYRRV
ncbi:putative lipase ATG15 [Hypsizygus marmoreus]|uniref:triacylglycerol lipase n=1 Tax=Hypsizygus marmoreus TaxID=39966 RepID=A0A369JD85_HYPMA|nr:putative lipase ATG15 [Hypsizygus marmoreus]